MEQTILSRNPTDYYTDKKNISNQTLVRMTIKHIETERRDMFDVLEFLNLLDNQCLFINNAFGQTEPSNYDTIKEEQKHIPDTIINHLQSLPLSDEQKHVLYGFILLWACGGNPDNLLITMQRVTYKEIQALFLDYPGDTPEKRYCTLENYLEQKEIDDNTPPAHFEDALEMTNWYKFSGSQQLREQSLIIASMFNRWIENIDHLAVKDMDKYKQYLTIDNFEKFLKENPDIVETNPEPVDRIASIKKGDVINDWANGKCGKFRDIDNTGEYRFVEMRQKKDRTVEKLARRGDDRSFPIVAHGFIAHLIKHWGEDSTITYSGYLQVKLNQYKAEHRNDADAFKRDLEHEFYDQYRAKEELWVKQSETIFDFILEPEVNKIKEYVNYYFEYVSQFETKSNPAPQPEAAEQSKSNANKANTVKPQRTINAEKLKDYFVLAFYNKQNNTETDYFTEYLIPDLQKNFDGKHFAAIALLIYNSPKMRQSKAVKPKSFKAWLQTFSSLIGIKYTDYKQSTLKDTCHKLSSSFDYLQ